MTLDVTVYEELLAADVPEPFASVFHPENEYPVRVGRVDEIVTVVP